MSAQFADQGQLTFFKAADVGPRSAHGRQRSKRLWMLRAEHEKAEESQVRRYFSCDENGYYMQLLKFGEKRSSGCSLSSNGGQEAHNASWSR